MSERDAGSRFGKKILLVLGGMIVILILLTIVGMAYAKRQMAQAVGNDQKEYQTYDRHYVLITQDSDVSIWEEVFQGCQEEAESGGAYVEWYGKNLEADFSRADLMKMAIAEKVDGIILEADESEELKELIDEAVKSRIPVVTVLTDSYGSSRQSCVEISSYNLGREYGRQIIKVATKDMKKVLVLMDSQTDDRNQNIICNGIRETLNNEGNHLRLELELAAVDSKSSFGSAEEIRNMLVNMEELPDIIVCLTQQNTISVYQAVVDYNIVGQVEILGYYTSDEILEAIQKKIIAATVSVDFAEMGSQCVNALDEYRETGYVNELFLIDPGTVNQSNVKEYLKYAAED